MDSIERISSHPALAEAEILRLRGLLEQRWRTIDSAPRTSKSILVWCPDRQNTYIVTWDRRDEGAWRIFGGSNFLVEEPAHWMPLPEPPTSTDTTAAN